MWGVPSPGAPLLFLRGLPSNFHDAGYEPSSEGPAEAQQKAYCDKPKRVHCRWYAEHGASLPLTTLGRDIGNFTAED
jgi:hypothetical protein